MRYKTFVVGTTLKGREHDSGTEDSILLNAEHSKTDSSRVVKTSKSKLTPPAMRAPSPAPRITQMREVMM